MANFTCPLAADLNSRYNKEMSISTLKKNEELDKLVPTKSLETSSCPNNLSYNYKKCSDSPFVSQETLGTLVKRAAGRWTHRECLYDVAKGSRLSFQDVDQQSDGLAIGLLQAVGLEKGDRIGIWGPNSAKWVITFLAASKAGLVSVCINAAYEAGELEYCLNKAGVKALVIAGAHKGQNYFDILTQIVPELGSTPDGTIENQVYGDRKKSGNVTGLTTVIMMDGEDEQKFGAVEIWSFDHLVRKGQKGNENDPQKLSLISKTVRNDDLTCIQFTSGTTGKSKGVMMTHEMLTNSAWAFNQAFKMTEKDKLCVPLPSFHAYGLFAGVLTPFLCGSPVVLPSPKFSPTAAIREAAKEKCTIIYGTPTMHADMVSLTNFDQFDLRSLRLASTSGASASESLIQLMKAKYAVKNVIVTLGTTETLAIASTPFCCEGENWDREKFTSTSLDPLENVEVKVINELGQIVPMGKMGELCVRSSSVMPGYWNDPEKTREVIDASNWFHTGDACVMGKSGLLSVVGRFKDVINRGGEKIHPKDVEDFLCGHPSILEAHVFGVFDRRLGEVVAAWVLLKKCFGGKENKNSGTLTATQLQQYCKGRISSFKIPTYIKLFEDSSDIPKSGTGKISKNTVRAIYEKELGLCP